MLERLFNSSALRRQSAKRITATEATNSAAIKRTGELTMPLQIAITPS
jgi:hypothetical protein